MARSPKQTEETKTSLHARPVRKSVASKEGPRIRTGRATASAKGKSKTGRKKAGSALTGSPERCGSGGAGDADSDRDRVRRAVGAGGRRDGGADRSRRRGREEGRPAGEDPGARDASGAPPPHEPPQIDGLDDGCRGAGAGGRACGGRDCDAAAPSPLPSPPADRGRGQPIFGISGLRGYGPRRVCGRAGGADIEPGAGRDRDAGPSPSPSADRGRGQPIFGISRLRGYGPRRVRGRAGGADIEPGAGRYRDAGPSPSPCGRPRERATDLRDFRASRIWPWTT